MIKQIDHLNNTDLERVAEIWLKSNLDAHDFISRDYWRENYDFVKEAFHTATIYAYYHDDTIVGFIGIIDDYIAGIFVLKEYRSLGIGTQLLKKIQSSHSKLTLHVYKRNESAVQFYLKNQFLIQEEKLEPETDERELSMKWGK